MHCGMPLGCVAVQGPGYTHSLSSFCWSLQPADDDNDNSVITCQLHLETGLTECHWELQVASVLSECAIPPIPSPSMLAARCTRHACLNSNNRAGAL